MKFRVERRYRGLDPLRKVVDLTDGSEFEEFLGLMAQCAAHRPRLVELFRSDALTARDLLRASREDRLGSLLPDERLLVPIGRAFQLAWATVAKQHPHGAARYRDSSRQLIRHCTELQTVQDLEGIDWEELSTRWPGGNSNWMHLFRAVSRFLTLHLGGGRVGRSHPWRQKVLDAIPRKREKKRVPDLPPAVFLRVVGLTPEHLRPCYMTLVITGLRLGEYLSLKRDHLRAHVFEVEVPGTKTESSAAVIPIDPALWRYIDLAVPCPVRVQNLRRHWHRACNAEGVKYKRLHDLRHCHGQWSVNEGVPESMVQASLRHTDPGMTRRYTMQVLRQGPAQAMARLLA